MCSGLTKKQRFLREAKKPPRRRPERSGMAASRHNTAYAIRRSAEPYMSRPALQSGFNPRVFPRRIPSLATAPPQRLACAAAHRRRPRDWSRRSGTRGRRARSRAPLAVHASPRHCARPLRGIASHEEAPGRTIERHVITCLAARLRWRCSCASCFLYPAPEMLSGRSSAKLGTSRKR